MLTVVTFNTRWIQKVIMHKFNIKLQNLNSTCNSVVSLFFCAVKLYLGNDKPEKIEENNQQCM